MKIDINNIYKICGKYKILYVENDLDVLKYTKKIFDRIFKKIDAFIDPNEALNAFYNNNYDVVIVDIFMTGMNGFDFIEKIRESESTIPVIIISGYKDTESLIKSIELGVNGYILKPFDLEYFLEIISKNVIKSKIKEEIQKRRFQKIIKLSDKIQREQKLLLKQLKIEKNKIKDSIKYASIIQQSILPDRELFKKYFQDFFVCYKPKDIVGGDLYLFNELRNNNECLLMVIDCTGHGIPGALVTMLVKAIETNLMMEIMNSPDMDISPAWILSFFNRSLKAMLNQYNTIGNINNVGFDGAIIYFNKRDRIITFAGAGVPLFYLDKLNNLKFIKADRYSVGYKRCDVDYKYTEHKIEIEEGMKFYITTDGYLDQIGGEKKLPLGKNRFKDLLKKFSSKSMNEQEEIFLNFIDEYKEDCEQNDDITIIGFEIGDDFHIIENNIVTIFKYNGLITQNVIATAIDNIEAKIKTKNLSVKISIIVVELCQNMMNYSKNIYISSNDISSEGSIEIQFIDNKYYKIISKNVVSTEDKEKLEKRLLHIKSLKTANEIKKEYRKLRKSGDNMHEKGGGIGLYEIAKNSDDIEYKFHYINIEKYYFILEVYKKR